MLAISMLVETTDTRRYSSTLFLALVLEGDEGLASRPGRILPLGRPDTHFTGGCVGLMPGRNRCRKFRPPPGFDPRTIQPVGSRYTDYASRHRLVGNFVLMKVSPLFLRIS